VHLVFFPGISNKINRFVISLPQFPPEPETNRPGWGGAASLPQKFLIPFPFGRKREKAKNYALIAFSRRRACVKPEKMGTISCMEGF